MDFYGLPATARASLALYNTCGEIDALAAAVRKAAEVFT
jgi:cysteine desulfurase/selenocysteine lyase